MVVFFFCVFVERVMGLVIVSVYFYMVLIVRIVFFKIFIFMCIGGLFVLIVMLKIKMV